MLIPGVSRETPIQGFQGESQKKSAEVFHVKHPGAPTTYRFHVKPSAKVWKVLPDILVEPLFKLLEERLDFVRAFLGQPDLQVRD